MVKVEVLGMILAGGQGSRLYPLTAKRAKPAVPFGAKYRIIDFVLNNFVNSGIYAIYVLTQYKAQSLTEHIQRYWRFGAFLEDHFILLVPAQMYRYEELGPVWYRGTADAIYQNLHLVQNHAPKAVAVFGGDHIFFRRVWANSYSLVERSVLFDDVEVGRYCRIRNAIVDKNVKIPPTPRSATTWSWTGPGASP